MTSIIVPAIPSIAIVDGAERDERQSTTVLPQGTRASSAGGRVESSSAMGCVKSSTVGRGEFSFDVERIKSFSFVGRVDHATC